MGKYKVEIADVNYWRKLIKCQWGCPVKTDARGYIIAINEGRYLDAYRLAREPNPFASICGRVCGAPCELDCRRESIDDTLTIRALKRFITEKHGVEAGDPGATIEFSSARRDLNNPKAGTPIAIIGAGVGGLTAAHDLALLGYKVTVFEAFSEPGGMLITGVPLYRLSRDLVKSEIDAILSLGVELRLNTEVGKDITIDELKKQGYAAVLIAIGLQKSRLLNMPGMDLDGVFHGIEFLKDVTTGEKVALGDRVIVIGGGNVAFDVARSAVRTQAKSGKHEFYEATETARSALRLGAKEVRMVCLESMAEMPADEIEIVEGRDEGVIIQNSRGPKEILGENGRVRALVTRKVTSVFDESGRFNPTFSDEEETFETDAVILAIGQATDMTFLNGAPDVEMQKNGIVKIDPATKKTSIPYIFACGDVADGAKLFIDAILSAQIAARSIDQYVRNSTLTETVVGTMKLPKKHVMSDRYIRLKQAHPEVTEGESRAKTTETIELPYPEEVAREQAERCLKCHINTIFHGKNCIMCNGCVDVCPTHCLKLVSLSQIEIDDTMKKLINNRYDVDVDELPEKERDKILDEVGSVMLKEEEMCIRCGYCARRCPTEAVTMEWFSYDIKYRFDP